MTPKLSVVEHLGLYSAFHQGERNRLIHAVGTPLVMLTGLMALALIAPSPGSFFHLGTLASLLLALAFSFIDVVGALVFGLALLALSAGAAMLAGVWPWWMQLLVAAGGHGLAWYLLIIVGHGDHEAPLTTPDGERDTHEYFRQRWFLGRNTGKETGALDHLLQFAIAPFAVVYELFEALGIRRAVRGAVDGKAQQVVEAIARGGPPLAPPSRDLCASKSSSRVEPARGSFQRSRPSHVGVG